MNNSKDIIRISGTGCALGDYLYGAVSYKSPNFMKYLSKISGDGGLSPGKLVFTEDIEAFSKKSYHTILKEIVGDNPDTSFNAGGPSLVSMIHASQLLSMTGYQVKFYGIAGNDQISSDLFRIISKTSLNIDNYHKSSNLPTPFTHVFSDPDYEKVAGERTFLNNIGAATGLTPEMLGNGFFDSEIVCFGGSALVPNLHKNLSQLLLRGKKNKCITVVNTVYDFRSEKRNPGKPWPLVKNIDDYELIDVLIMDAEEAKKISGTDNLPSAVKYFKASKVLSFFITNGSKDIIYFSRGGVFKKTDLSSASVSEYVIDKLLANPDMKGDTTGCGDNFAGGVITSLAWQLKNFKPGYFDIDEAATWGIASGGFTCFYTGGVYPENYPGEKLQQIRFIREEYLKQKNCIKKWQ